jgi:hypothetical protein
MFRGFRFPYMYIIPSVEKLSGLSVFPPLQICTISLWKNIENPPLVVLKYTIHGG